MISLINVFHCVPTKLMCLLLALMLMIQLKNVCHNVLNLPGLTLKMIQEPAFSDARTILSEKTQPGNVYNFVTIGKHLPIIQLLFVWISAQSTLLQTLKVIDVSNSVRLVTLVIIQLGNAF